MIKEDSKQSTIALLRNIIMSELELQDDQIAIYNQSWVLPADSGLHVVVQFLGAIPFSSRSWVDPTGQTEVQDLNMSEMYQIKILSRNDEALFRKHEILWALCSQYGQQVQEANSFRVAPISHGFSDVSEVEGVARINVFVITVEVLAWYQKTKAAKFYDSYELQTRTDAMPAKTAVQNVT